MWLARRLVARLTAEEDLFLGITGTVRVTHRRLSAGERPLGVQYDTVSSVGCVTSSWLSRSCTASPARRLARARMAETAGGDH